METKTSQLRGDIARSTVAPAVREEERGREQRAKWEESRHFRGPPAGDLPSQRRPLVTALYIIEAARVISGVLQSRPNQSRKKLPVPPLPP